MNKEIDISNLTLTTSRLILRPWKLSDLDDFYEYASVDGVGQMAGWLPHENKEVSARILKDFIEGKKTFALVYQNKVIGSLGIEKYNEAELKEFDPLFARELGFVLSKDYWGKGLMSEAVQEVVRYLFEDEGLDVIFCGHFVSNHQSKRVQEKNGFHFYKKILFTTRFNTVEETNLNLLYREEWMKMHENTK